VDLERLADEVARAAFDRLDRVLHRAVAGDDDRDDIRITLNRGFDHRGSIDPRQTKISNDDVERKIRETCDRRLSGISLLDVVATIGQLLGYGLAECGFVLHEEKMSCRLSHLER